MDFAEFDLRAASERGSWVHLKAPRNGKTGDGVEFKQGDFLFADQVGKVGPVRVLVKGFADAGIREAFGRSERVQMLFKHRMDRANDKEAEAIIVKYQEDLMEAMNAMVVAAIAEFENISENQKPLAFTPDNVLKYFGFSTAFFEQINSAITDQHRLFTKADTAS